jgi:hypothetical protein
VALAGAATVLALGASEAALQLLRARAAPPDATELRMEPDTLLGWVKPASTVGHRSDEEYELEEAINSRRLRGPEYPREKPPGESRVLLLGDSFAEAYTVPFDSSFSEVMKRQLNATSNRQVQVLNSGTAGWSTDQELLYYRTEGRGYDADVVVLLFYLNDVLSNAQTRYWRGRKPRFVLAGPGDSALVLQGVPVPAPPRAAGSPGEDGAGGPVRRAARAGGGGVLERSLLYRQLRAITMRNPALFHVARTVGLTSADAPERSEPPEEWGVWLRSPTPVVTEGWQVTAALLRAMRDEVEADGARFVIVHAPGREVVHPEFWAQALRTFRVDDTTHEPGRDERVLREICAESHLDCYFLREPMQRAATVDGDAERLYWSRNSHWNARGNREAGELVGAYLEERWLADETRRAAGAESGQ